MERYKSFCRNCKEKPITYENEWENGPPPCIYCKERLEDRYPFPFVRMEHKSQTKAEKKLSERRRSRNKRDVYGGRKKALSTLGYDNYPAYLCSDLWKEIRQRIIERDQKACQSCGGAGYEVHHLSYSLAVLEGREDRMLVLLCGHCHQLTEFDGKTKCSPAEAHARLKALLNGTPLPRINMPIKKQNKRQRRKSGSRK